MAQSILRYGTKFSHMHRSETDTRQRIFGGIMNKFENTAKESVMKIKPYVPGKPIEEVQRELQIRDVIKLASNENPLGPSKKAVKAIEGKLRTINLYPETSAYYLRESLAKQLKTDPRTLIFGNGSNELEIMLAQAFVEAGDEVMYSVLSFVVYPIVADMAGATSIVIPHKNFRHDMDAFIERLSPKTKLVFICNPNNPTGTIITKDEFEKFMQKTSSRTIVALDEAYFEYVHDKNYPDGLKYMAKYPNLVVLRTFSKIYGLAGLRIGFAAADKDIIEILERVRAPFNTNIPAQAAAEAALKDREHVKETIKVNEEGKKYLYKEFKKFGIKYVETYANFIFTIFNQNSKIVFENLLKKGIIIRPVFDNFARITIGKMEENKRLIKALKQVL